MRSAFIRSTLAVATHVEVADPSGTWWRVEAVRTGEWDGSPMARNYLLMLLLGRIWRWLRRDQRWDVALVRSPSLWRWRHKVLATFPSRDIAIEQAVEVASRIQAGTSI